MEVVLRCWVPLPGVYGSGLYMGAQKLLGSGAPFSTVVGAAPKICLSAALPPAPLFRARIVWIPHCGTEVTEHQGYLILGSL